MCGIVVLFSLLRLFNCFENHQLSRRFIFNFAAHMRSPALINQAAGFWPPATPPEDLAPARCEGDFTSPSRSPVSRGASSLRSRILFYIVLRSTALRAGSTTSARGARFADRFREIGSPACRSLVQSFLLDSSDLQSSRSDSICTEVIAHSVAMNRCRPYFRSSSTSEPIHSNRMSYNLRANGP